MGQFIFHTDLHGDIEIGTDGRKLWIKTERDGEQEAQHRPRAAWQARAFLDMICQYKRLLLILRRQYGR